LLDSRQSIKKYVQNNNKINITSQAAFDAQFNKAIKVGVEKGEFTQPKGTYLSLYFFFLPRRLVIVAMVFSKARLRYFLCDSRSFLLFTLLMHFLTGPSGPVKLAKKEPAKPTPKPAAAKVSSCFSLSSISFSLIHGQEGDYYQACCQEGSQED
jgi:linker histone H1 and H5 family.